MTSQEGSSSKADLQAVWSAFWKGCSRLVFEEAPRAWQGPEQSQYRVEREKILAHLRPVGMGIFVTAFCFVTFRVSGSKWWRQIRTSLLEGASTVTAATSMAARSTTPLAGEQAGYVTRQAQAKQDKVQELMQLPLDFTLSVLLGSSAFLLLFDSDQMQDDLVQIPLLPGKSLVHECVCANVVRAVQQAHQQGSLNATDEETKKFFTRFVENCQTRSRYLERRRELGHPNDMVPYPGLVGKIAR